MSFANLYGADLEHAFLYGTKLIGAGSTARS